MKLGKIVTLCLAPFVLSAAHAADIGQVVENCAAIAADDDRLRCFDAVAAAHADSASPAAGSVAPVAPKGPEPVAADFGLENLKDAPRQAQEFAATIVRCEENKAISRYFFYLENGQVWKQTNHRRLGWKDCNFDARLTKDGFGYKLLVPSENRSIRVRRVR